MKEDFLHYLWVNKKLPFTHLKTHLNENLEIKHFGQYLQNAGPDIFNAHIVINNQTWAGNVEIHVKSSDWYVHHHEENAHFDSVILHVVWEHDCPIFRKDNTEIPTLELKNLINPNEVVKYQELTTTKNFINCENQIANTNDFIWKKWQETLFVERLEKKSEEINLLLIETQNNWEAVLYFVLVKYFGLKTNGNIFIEMAKHIGFNVIRKEMDFGLSLEALFYGSLNLIPNNCSETYSVQLTQQFNYLKVKYNLVETPHLSPQFFKLRPDNFPTIRLSQLANLLVNQHNLFSKIVSCNKVEEIKNLFKTSASVYWKNHYNFCKESKIKSTQLSSSFIDLIILNVVVPLLYGYQKHTHKINLDWIIALTESIKPENNSLIDSFKKCGVSVNNAFQSQALLQQKNNYCNLNKCLNCVIGLQVLKN